MPATSTIPYDLPVADYIAQLDATGHVTHQSFTKKSVTLHHNGGVNFSHDEILTIWKTRPASAHFDVDTAGSVAQYVRVLEYAWATGSTQGNEESISIEMADATGSPGWQVSDTTWRAAARLAAWLFANVVHARPDAANFFVHHHWYATSCAGPYIDSIWSQVLAEAQHQYDLITAPKTPKPSGDWFTMASMADLETAVKDAVEALIPDISKAVWHYTMVDANSHLTSRAQDFLVGTRGAVARVEGTTNALAAKTVTAADIKAAIQSVLAADAATDQGGTSPSAI